MGLIFKVFLVLLGVYKLCSYLVLDTAKIGDCGYIKICRGIVHLANTCNI